MITFHDQGTVIASWGLDMANALYDLPKWRRLLLRVVMGRFAYREFAGMVQSLDDCGFYLNGYELHNMGYHKDNVPNDFKELTDA